MAKDLSTRITGGPELQANIAKLKRLAPEFTKNAVNATAIAVQARAKLNITDNQTVDTGRLRASVKIETFSGGFSRRVGSDLKYAPSIEFGSRPHFPPLEPIREWCRRHRIPESAAYPIALKIAKNGTPAAPFLYPALEVERHNFEQMIRKEWRRLSGELA
jgi:HK97 gp10 family phage protein